MDTHLRRVAISIAIVIAAITSSSHSGNAQLFRSRSECEAWGRARVQAGTSRGYECVKRLISRPFAQSATFNKNVIEQMYRGKRVNGQWQSSDMYPGGLAGAIRRQLSKGELVGGVDHLQKGIARLAQLKNIITRGKIGNEVLSTSDIKLARELHDDLLAALQTKPNR